MSNKIPLNKLIPESPISYISSLSPLNLPQINLPKLHFPNRGYFGNAKPARMLELGWKLSTVELNVGDEGIYIEKNGPTFIVKVKAVRCIPIAELHKQNSKKYEMEYLRMFEAKCVNEYIFTNMETGADLNPYNDYERSRMREWSFYTKVDPVPFVPRKGAGRFTKRRKVSRRRTGVKKTHGKAVRK
jgi:hypothetical protein